MNRVNIPSEPSTEGTLDLADILLTLAENIRLLVIGPLVLGLIAFGIAHLLPQKFESVAILNAEPSIATLLTSTPVLDGALKRLGHLKNLNETEVEEVRLRFTGQVSAQVGRSDQLVTLRVTERSPEAAQRMATEILNQTMEMAKPREVELQRLTLERDTLSQQAIELASASKIAQRILERGDKLNDLGTLVESIAVISQNLIKVQESLHKVEQKLIGMSAADVLQAPTLPKDSFAPNKPLIAILATLVSGLFILVFVFARQALKTSVLSERHEARWSALKNKYHIGR